MRISSRFRWAIGLAGLKVLAATVIFVYSKHKAAGPPGPFLRPRAIVETGRSRPRAEPASISPNHQLFRTPFR
jgi:hypothetical protein